MEWLLREAKQTRPVRNIALQRSVLRSGYENVLSFHVDNNLLMILIDDSAFSLARNLLTSNFIRRALFLTNLALVLSRVSISRLWMKSALNFCGDLDLFL